MKTIKYDPIIAELYAFRDEYSARFDHDVGKMFQDLRARQDTSKWKYVSYPPRPAVGNTGKSLKSRRAGTQDRDNVSKKTRAQ